MYQREELNLYKTWLNLEWISVTSWLFMKNSAFVAIYENCDTFHFASSMDEKLFHDLFYYKINGKKPQHLKGAKNKGKWRSFQKTSRLYEVFPKKGFEGTPRDLLDTYQGNLFRVFEKKKGEKEFCK